MRGFRFRHPRKLSSHPFSPDPTDCPWVSDSEDAVSVKSREKRTSGTLGLGTILLTFVETLVTLRPLRR